MRKAEPRLYHDLEEIGAKQTVSTWLGSLTEGQSRKNAIYSIARYLRWREKKGLEADPDKIIEDCLGGTNRTLVDYVQVLLGYCKGSEFKGTAPISVRRHYDSIRSFYLNNMVTLPKAKFKAPDARTSEVKAEVTADAYLGMMRKALSAASPRGRSIMLTAFKQAL